MDSELATASASEQLAANVSAAVGQAPTDLAVTLLLVLLSGLGAYLQRCRDDGNQLGALDLFTELLQSLTAGLCVFYLCKWQATPAPLMFFFVLIASNSGRDSLSILRGVASKLLKLRFK